jgi:hypothetical protein
MKTLKFNNLLIAYSVVNGTPYLPVKTLCEALGIEYIRQFKIIKDHPIFAKVLYLSPIPSDGGEQQTTCLPLKFALAWLMQINPNRVGERSREDLIRLQMDCYDAVYAHFMGGDFETQRREAERAARYRARAYEITREINALKNELKTISRYLKKIETAQMYLPCIMDEIHETESVQA